MVKNLFRKFFLHSPKRTFLVVGSLIVMLALPITLITVQKQQDLRQRASCSSFLGIGFGSCTPDPYKLVCSGDLNKIPLVVEGSYDKSIEAYEAAGLDDLGEINLKDIAKEIALSQTVAATAALDTLKPLKRVPYALIVKDSTGTYYAIDSLGNFGDIEGLPTYEEALARANTYGSRMQAYGTTASKIGDESQNWERIAKMLNTNALYGEELDNAMRTAATNLGTTYQDVYKAATDGSGRIDDAIAAINKLEKGKLVSIEAHTLGEGTKTFATTDDLIRWLSETKSALNTIKNAQLITRDSLLATEPLTFTTRGASKLIPILKFAAKTGFVLDLLTELTRDTGQHFYMGCSTDRKYMSSISINTDLKTFQYYRTAVQCPQDSLCAYQSNTCVQCVKVPEGTINNQSFTFSCNKLNPKNYFRNVSGLTNVPRVEYTCPDNKDCNPLSNGIECVAPAPIDNCSDPSGSGLQYKCSPSSPGAGWTESSDKTCTSGTCYWYSGGGGTRPSCSQVYPTSTCKKQEFCSDYLYEATGTTCETQGEGWGCCSTQPPAPQKGSGGSTGGGSTYQTPTPTPTPALPSVGSVLVETCVGNDPSSARFNWTREKSGLNYEVAWGSTSTNLNEKLSFGDTSQTNAISGFTPGTVYYSVRAYLGNVAGPSSVDKFTVPSTCSGTGGNKTVSNPPATSPSPVVTTTVNPQCSVPYGRPNGCACTAGASNCAGDCTNVVNGTGICANDPGPACANEGEVCGGGGALNRTCCGSFGCYANICTAPVTCTGCSVNSSAYTCKDDNSKCDSGYICKNSNCIVQPTPTPTKTAEQTAAASCSSNGVKSLTYNQSGCPNYTFAKSVTVICNDESTKTISAQFGCTNTLGLKLSAQSYCSSHKACPTATPTITPTPTNTPVPTRTNTPTPTTKPPLSCDANKDGVTNDADLPIIKSEWFGGATTKNADCNKDGVVNGLDFQMWRDVWILKKS